MLTTMTRILLITDGFLAGAAISAGVNAVMRARDWPARERLGMWLLAILLWAGALLTLIFGLIGPL